MNEAERDALRFSSLEGLRPLVGSGIENEGSVRRALWDRVAHFVSRRRLSRGFGYTLFRLYRASLIAPTRYYLKGNIRRGGPERLAHMCYFRARGI